jgi:AcrR family transcriptional regulator
VVSTASQTNVRRTGARTPRPPRLPAEERREHFLDVAADLVAGQGVESVTMEGVAAAAGVSKGLGYAYFTNRDDLLLAVLDRETDDLWQRVQLALQSAECFEDQIRGAVSAWFDAVRERGAVLGPLMSAGALREALQDRHNVMQRNFEEFYGGLVQKEFDIPRRQAVAAAAILLAGLTGVLERWSECCDPRPMLEDTYVTLAVGGLQALQALRDAPS